MSVMAPKLTQPALTKSDMFEEYIQHVWWTGTQSIQLSSIIESFLFLDIRSVFTCQLKLTKYIMAVREYYPNILIPQYVSNLVSNFVVCHHFSNVHQPDISLNKKHCLWNLLLSKICFQYVFNANYRKQWTIKLLDKI